MTPWSDQLENTHLPHGSHARALTVVLRDCLGYGAVANEAEDTEGHSALKTAGEPYFPTGKASQ